MKSKFQNLNFGSVALLSQDEQRKVKGGYIPSSGNNVGSYPTPIYISPGGPNPGNDPGAGPGCIRYYNPATGETSKDSDPSRGITMPQGCNN